MALTILLALLLVFVVYGFRLPDRWRLRHIPGPPQMWLFGNLLSIAQKGNHAYFNELHKRYGSIFKVWTLGSAVVVCTPELCRQVMLHNTARFMIPNLFTGKIADFEQSGILFTRGEQARTIRGAWHPLFYSSTLQGFMSLMHAAADKAVQRFAAAAKSNEVVNAHALISAMVLQIISNAAYGLDISDPDAVLDTIDGKPYKARQMIEDIKMAFRTVGNPNCPYTRLMFLLPIGAPLWKWLANKWPSANHAAALDLRNRMMPFAAKLLKEHTAAVKEQGDASKAFKPAASPPADAGSEALRRQGVAAGSFIDILVRTKYKSSGVPLTDLEMSHQVYGMLLGGLETTANALSFAMYCLALHPDKADKLAAEIHAHAERNPDYPSLTEGFPYTEAVLREAMRLYPPGTNAIREAEKDLNLGGYKVPKGSRLLASIYAVHHDEAVWPQAETFIPERHLSADAVGAPTQPHAWIGFGDGARNCVGSRLAMLEAKLALVHLFRDYSYRLEAGQTPLKLHSGLTLGPKHAVWVTVQERKDPSLAPEP